MEFPYETAEVWRALTISIRFDHVIRASGYAKDIGACTEKVRKLRSLPPNGFLDEKLVADCRQNVHSTSPPRRIYTTV
jgi:hypothetical protein